MAWCRPGDKPLFEPMMFSLLTHICVTRPHWAKIRNWLKAKIHQPLVSFTISHWIGAYCLSKRLTAECVSAERDLINPITLYLSCITSSTSECWPVINMGGLMTYFIWKGHHSACGVAVCRMVKHCHQSRWVPWEPKHVYVTLHTTWRTPKEPKIDMSISPLKRLPTRWF